MSEEKRSKVSAWATIFFAVAASFLAGVGTSQVTLAATSSRHTEQIGTINKALDRHDTEHTAIRVEFTTRLTALVGEQANYVQMSREFIQQMKADREVMNQILAQNDKLMQRLNGQNK